MNLPAEIKEMALQVPERKQKEVQKLIKKCILMYTDVCGLINKIINHIKK